MSPYTKSVTVSDIQTVYTDDRINDVIIGGSDNKILKPLSGFSSNNRGIFGGYNNKMNSYGFSFVCGGQNLTGGLSYASTVFCQ